MLSMQQKKDDSQEELNYQQQVLKEMILLCGKTYKNNSFHQLYKITDVYNNGDIKLVHDRQGME